MKKEKNYARKYAKDLNFLTFLYQKYALILFHTIIGLFYKFEYNGRENIPKNKKLVVAPNHISYFDPLVVTAATHLKISYMAKKELFEGSKWFAKRIDWLGAFAVNREKVEVSSIKSALDVFKANWNLGIFPQGGIRRNRKIENLNKGFINFAKMVKADILPVGITGCEQYQWKLFSGNTIKVKIGKPISYKLSEDEIIKIYTDEIYELTGYEKDPNETVQQTQEKALV